MQACSVLSNTGLSHPFDGVEAKGYVRCEGVGAIILRRLSDAKACRQRIDALVLHAAAGQAGTRDGESAKGTLERGEGEVIMIALTSHCSAPHQYHHRRHRHHLHYCRCKRGSWADV